MKAAWYEKQGEARDVLIVGEMPDPKPGEGEVRIRVAASGINPGDVKKRQNAFGYGMPYPRVVPHSDGAGTIDAVGKGVSEDWIGKPVWCHGAQTYRPFGTAAEYVVVPLQHAVPLPAGVSVEQGACLGIPGITAHRAAHAAGPVRGRTVLVQGGAGAVGAWAVQLAHQAGARVIATCRSEGDREIALQAGADEVLLVDETLIQRIRAALTISLKWRSVKTFKLISISWLKAVRLRPMRQKHPSQRFRSGRSFLVMRRSTSLAATIFRPRRKSMPPMT
jgi:NADPH2:quinone reductase